MYGLQKWFISHELKCMKNFSQIGKKSKKIAKFVQLSF